MKIKLQDGKPASQDAIASLEAALGCRLSDSFRSFVATYDGARPQPNIFRVSDNNDCGVNEFIPVHEIEKVCRNVEKIGPRAYPVAWAECGNYVCVDEDRNGAVFFWDHEVPDEPTELAASFGSFLDLLEPFDIGTIPLKPGQVKKVWIDPEFAKTLRK